MIEYVVRGLPYELPSARPICRKCHIERASYTVYDEHGTYNQWCADCTIDQLTELRDSVKTR